MGFKKKMNKLTINILITVLSATLAGCSGLVQNTKKPRINGCHQYDAKATPTGSVIENGMQVGVMAWGKDLTDNSSVGWNQPYPSPCFDDDPKRRGKPNAAWQGDFYLQENKICFTANNLYAKYVPNHTLTGGYEVALANGTFKDGSTNKFIPLFTFDHKPKQTSFTVCEEIIVTKKTAK